jgi:hypothetical protein
MLLLPVATYCQSRHIVISTLRSFFKSCSFRFIFLIIIIKIIIALNVLSESSHSDGKAEESDAVGSDRIEVVPASSEISGLPSSSPDVVVQISSAAQEIIEYCGSALKCSTVTSVAGRGQRPPHQQPLVSPSMRYGCHVYLIMVIINLFQDYFLLLIY